MARLGRAYPQQRIWTPRPVAVVGGGGSLAFDAVGAGAVDQTGTTSISDSWNHTATAGAHVLTFISDFTFNTTLSSATLSATYGGTAMTYLGGIDDNSSDFGWQAVFHLGGVPGGLKTAAINISGVSSYAVVANSVSYTGVSSVGSLLTTSGSSGSTSQSVSAASGKLVVQAFGAINSGGGSSLPALSSYSQTQRYSQSEAQAGFPNSGACLLIGDAPGASTVSFAASLGGVFSYYWGGVAVVLS